MEDSKSEAKNKAVIPMVFKCLASSDRITLSIGLVRSHFQVEHYVQVVEKDITAWRSKSVIRGSEPLEEPLEEYVLI